MTNQLPPGFVLDPVPNAGSANLPLGFVLDDMASQEQQPNIAHKGNMAPGDRVPADLHATTTQGILMGGADEFAAGVTSPIKALENRLRGEGPTSIGENYDQQKAYLDAQLAATYEQHPIAAPVTEFAGAVIAPGGVGARAAIKAPHLINKIGRGALTGAGYGGLYGFNSGDGLDNRLEKASEGAATGAFIGGTVPVAGSVLGAGYRGLTKAFGDQRAADTLQRFDRAGVRPTAGAVTSSRPIQMVEQALANTPGSGGRMQIVAATQADQFAQRADDLANRFGEPLPPQGAGEVIREASRAATQRFEQRQEELYDRAFSHIGSQTATHTPHTSDYLYRLLDERMQAGGSRNDILLPIINKVQSIVKAGAKGIPFEDFRRLRTDIGRMTKVRPQGMSESAQIDKIRGLYAVLTKDMQGAARQAGPHAERALAVADRYTRFNLTVNQKLWQKLENTQVDELAYRYAVQGAQHGGSRLAKLRRNFTADEWDTVAATVFDQLGKAQPHVRGAAELGGAAKDFSLNTFLTHWEKLSPEARLILFGGKRYAGLTPAINDLVKSMSAAKDVGRMANTSGTARQLLTAGQYAAAGSAALAGQFHVAAGILVGPWVTARLMTSPRFIRMLAAFAKSGDRGSTAVQRFAANLGIVGSQEPDIQQDLLKLQRQLLSNKLLQPAA